jgi:hypothetical protein
MGPRQPVAIEFPNGVGVVYHPGIEFPPVPGPEPPE